MPDGNAAWWDLGPVPESRVRAWTARAFLRRSVAPLALRIVHPDGRVFGAGSSEAPALIVHDPDAFYRRIGSAGLVGVGESYQAAEWDSVDLAGLLTVFAEGIDRIVPRAARRLRPLVTDRRPDSDDNTPENARQNVARHYDLPHQMFEVFLDHTMTYSSAVFPVGPGTGADALTQAQDYKLDRLLRQAGVGPGRTVLDIGAGWGELALRAAAKGAGVRAVTLSKEQYRYISERVERAGLAGRVDVQFGDYREVEGRYDTVFSIEMMEAVGHAYLPEFLAALDRLVAPGGRVILQSTVMRHDRMVEMRDSNSWIKKYIFPGSALPSVTSIEAAVAGQKFLHIVDEERFRFHYAQTLRLWRQRFEAGADRLTTLGFDTTFQRTWRFYLAWCEAGFRSGVLDVARYVLEPGRGHGQGNGQGDEKADASSYLRPR